MEDSHGKDIDLQKTTVKIPGAMKPRIAKTSTQIDQTRLNNEINTLNLCSNGSNLINNIQSNIKNEKNTIVEDLQINVPGNI